MSTQQPKTAAEERFEEEREQWDTGTGYKWGELHRAFTAVQDPANWKNPIDSVIDAAAQDVTLQAVMFFAGCVPTFTKRQDGRLRVKAVGYYVAVGA